jgi:hypothetical protein
LPGVARQVGDRGPGARQALTTHSDHHRDQLTALHGTRHSLSDSTQPAQQYPYRSTAVAAIRVLSRTSWARCAARAARSAFRAACACLAIGRRYHGRGDGTTASGGRPAPERYPQCAVRALPSDCHRQADRPPAVAPLIGSWLTPTPTLTPLLKILVCRRSRCVIVLTPYNRLLSERLVQNGSLPSILHHEEPTPPWLAELRQLDGISAKNWASALRALRHQRTTDS